MHYTIPVALVAAAVAVSAAPLEARDGVVKAALTKVRGDSGKYVYRNGKARLDKVNGKTSSKRDSSADVTNIDESYTADVIIGGDTWSLIVDSGSSNTWCGAQTTCEPTSTGVSTGDSISVEYGSGEFSGEEYTDTVEFADLTVKKQSIGAATSSEGFTGVDGIIGFGPVDLTEDTVSGVDEVPTFMNNLYSEGLITTEVLGISFRPEPGSDTDDTNGVLTLGGVDTSLYSGDLTYFDILTSGESSYYWGIEVAKFTYDTTSLETDVECIVDTGTTLIYVPQTAYDEWLDLADGTTNEDSGLATFTTEPTKDFYVTFGTTEYSLTPSQYLIPTDQYDYYGLSTGSYYSYIANGGTGSTTEDILCILGQKWIEQIYTVLDTTSSQIGFAVGV